MNDQQAKAFRDTAEPLLGIVERGEAEWVAIVVKTKEGGRIAIASEKAPKSVKLSD